MIFYNRAAGAKPRIITDKKKRIREDFPESFLLSFQRNRNSGDRNAGDRTDSYDSNDHFLHKRTSCFNSASIYVPIITEKRVKNEADALLFTPEALSEGPVSG